MRPEDGLHTAVAGPFMLLEFESALSVCYVELKDRAVYLQDPDQVDVEDVVPGPVRKDRPRLGVRRGN